MDEMSEILQLKKTGQQKVIGSSDRFYLLSC
jgi:hypothetical protein